MIRGRYGVALKGGGRASPALGLLVQEGKPAPAAQGPQAQHQAQEGLAAWEETAELREGLVRSRPDDLDRQRDLAEAYERLGFAYDTAGRDSGRGGGLAVRSTG